MATYQHQHGVAARRGSLFSRGLVRSAMLTYEKGRKDATLNLPIWDHSQFGRKGLYNPPAGPHFFLEFEGSNTNTSYVGSQTGNGFRHRGGGHRIFNQLANTHSIMSNSTGTMMCRMEQRNLLLSADNFTLLGVGSVATALSQPAMMALTLNGDVSGVRLRFEFNRQQNSAGNNHIIQVNNTGLDDGASYHIAVTADSSEWKLYIDGAKQTVFVNTGTNDGHWLNHLNVTSDVYLGIHATMVDGAWTRQRLSGFVNDVRVYDRALSSAEIAQIAAGHG